MPGSPAPSPSCSSFCVFFASRRRHTRCLSDWSSDVCSSDLDQAVKLASTLLSTDGSQYYILVSIGGKIGSGRLIGANEGERLMRPFDASVTNDKGKDIVPAKRLEFVGGYAGLWKVTFDTKSLRGPVLNNESKNAIFEARLNQNLDFKAKFPPDKIMDIEPPAWAPANPAR